MQGPALDRGRSMVTSLKGLNVGGATHEKRLMRVGRREREKKRKRAEWRRSQSPQLLCLVTFLQNMIAARFGVGMIQASLCKHKQGGAAACFMRTRIPESGL